MSEIQVRVATERDLTAINDIYNHYVLHSTCTYQLDAETMPDRIAWFANHGCKHPVIVAEENGVILGWGSLSRYHPRAAYARTVENSVYVDHRHCRRGIGSIILVNLIQRARELGHHTIIAGIDGEQTSSMAIHAKFGFTRVGHMKQLGWKFDRWLDVVYMQLML